MKTVSTYILIYLCLICFNSPLKAQKHLGKEYTEIDFTAHPIMWNATVDACGRIYFANNNGVCRFDGQNFYTFKTNSPVRNLVFGEENKLYTASLGDFGVLTFQSNGKFLYESLKEKFNKKNIKTGGSENVFKLDNSIYFSCQNYLIQLSLIDNTITDYKDAISNNLGVFCYQNKLYVNTPEYGLGVFENGKVKIISSGNMLVGKNISAASIINNSMVLVEPNGKCYKLSNNKLDTWLQLPEKNIVAITALPDNQFAIGTLNKGAFVVNTNGKIISEVASNSKEIYSLFTDLEGNLWTAHNKGLQHTWLQLPIKEINAENIIGTISDMCFFHNNLYVSSSGGVYKISDNIVVPINQVAIECWDLQEFNGKLFVASTDGLLVLENNKLISLIPGETFLHLQVGNNTKTLFALGENDVYQINKLGSTQKLNNVPALSKATIEENGKPRYILSYQDGLFDTKTNTHYFELKEGEKHLRIWKNKPYLQVNHELFSLPIQLENDAPSKEATAAIGLNQNNEILIEENAYLITKNGIKIAGKDSPKPVSILSVLRGKTVAVHKLKNEIWIAQADKIFVASKGDFTYKKPQVLINSLREKSDVFSFLGFYLTKDELPAPAQEIVPSLSGESFPISLQFSLNTFYNINAHQFSYKIEELSNEWTDWQSISSLDWPIASTGTYTIHIKGMDSFGNVSDEKVFKFYIEVPWYLSGFAILCYIVIASILVYLIVIFNQKQLITKNRKLEEKVKERTKELEEEKGKSDNLLLNILPQEVADELKSTGKYEAKQFDDITVLFTDFVGFTSISEKLSPKELVAEIHYCFKAFDEIIIRCKLEKIKTIGDAYMAVCGMPNKDNLHAIRTVEAAIEIQTFINRYQQERKEANKSFFEIRMGIHSGSVIAGIVGVRKYAYDIWGDTVNTAARMEQNSEPGKINISGITYELIKNKYKCSYRGKIEAKNKGRIDMYFVQNLL